MILILGFGTSPRMKRMRRWRQSFKSCCFFSMAVCIQLLIMIMFTTTMMSSESFVIVEAFQQQHQLSVPSSSSSTTSLRNRINKQYLNRRREYYYPHQQQVHPRKQMLRVLLTSAASFSNNEDQNDENDENKTAIPNNNNQQQQYNYNWTSQTMRLALPALIGMLVDPLLSMTDTAYVGNLSGGMELAALGACTSIFHLAFNAFRATTSATTSLVGTAKTDSEKQTIIQISLVFGVLSGILVSTLLRHNGPWILQCMGIVGPQNPLFPPALSYLRTRSLAAPAVLSITVCEGAFRGYGNTKIPLMASLVAAVLNLVLDPVLMLPPFSRGVQGAAAATAVSQVGALGVYVWFLVKRKMLIIPTLDTIKNTLLKKRGHKKQQQSITASSSTSSIKNVIRTIIGANLAMICKQGSLLLGWAFATAKATRIGSAHVAAHQVALSCWLVFALLQDAAGVSSQVLLTRVLNGDNNNDNSHSNNAITNAATTCDDRISTHGSSNTNNYEKLKSLVKYMLRLSIIQGLVVTGLFLLITPFLPGWFVPNDPIVRRYLQKLLPHVALQQLLVSTTLICESLVVAGQQFKLLALGTTISTILSVIQIRSATTIVSVWSKGIVTLFVGRLITAGIGTFRILHQSNKKQVAAAAIKTRR